MLCQRREKKVPTLLLSIDIIIQMHIPPVYIYLFHAAWAIQNTITDITHLDICHVWIYLIYCTLDTLCVRTVQCIKCIHEPYLALASINGLCPQNALLCYATMLTGNTIMLKLCHYYAHTTGHFAYIRVKSNINHLGHYPINNANLELQQQLLCEGMAIVVLTIYGKAYNCCLCWW